MKKYYSKTLGVEAFALDVAQLDILKKAGYTVPSPEAVIADPAVRIEPPEDARAYVVFNFKSGAFTVRTRTQTLAGSEVGAFVGEVVSAAVLCSLVERADPDRPKKEAPAASATASPMSDSALLQLQRHSVLLRLPSQSLSSCLPPFCCSA